MAELGSLLDMDKQLTDAELIELGRRHLAEKELRDLADLRRAALAEAEGTTKLLKARLVELNEEGGVNEVEMAELLRVDRMTVRNWLGKQTRKRRAPATAQESPVDSALLS
jgi:hypothetical protein